MNPNRFPEPANDHAINELEGYVELGMKSATFDCARRLLRRRNITAPALNAAVSSILITADQLHRWRRQIEAAYARLPKHQRELARYAMLSFYVSRDDWKSAAAFVPETSQNPAELLFSMWTLLELRRDTDARRIYRQCRQLWRTIRVPANAVADYEHIIATLIEAMACYLAQQGCWSAAQKCWTAGTQVRPFASNAWEGLLSLHTLRALSATDSALAECAEDPWFSDDMPLLFRKAENGPDLAGQRQLRKYRTHLSRVVPERERFRFGIAPT